MRLKDIVDVVNEKTNCVDRPYVALENIVSWDAKFVASNAATEGTNACFKAGDVLFGKLRPYLAKGYLPDYDGICSTEFLVMRPHDGMDGRYLLYWLLSPDFIGVIKNRVAGVKMPRTDWATVSQMELTPPSLSAQRQIVAYLDGRTAAIDARVAVLEKKLAAYKRLKASVINRAVTRGLDPKAKLKDSGVDWIGKVPTEWSVAHLKRLTKKIGSGKTPSGGAEIYSTEGVMFLRSQNVYDGGLVLDDVAFITPAIDLQMASTRVFPSDVLLNITGGSIGRCCVYTRQESANVNQHVCIIRADSKQAHNAYIKYFWNTLGQVYLRLSQLGGNRESLTFEQIGNVPFPCPPLAEQRAIADYLDAECEKIDTMAELVTREIGLYKKLKRSLINEVVTGKRKVA